jgi:hypothetical protein
MALSSFFGDCPGKGGTRALRRVALDDRPFDNPSGTDLRNDPTTPTVRVARFCSVYRTPDALPQR